MYDIQWGHCSPGHLIFLIDQSGSMVKNNNHEIVVKAVQEAVWECLLNCVSGSDIRNRFYLTIIGYGNDVIELHKSWIGDREFIAAINNARNNQKSFLEAKADGITPMAAAFAKASETVRNWLNSCEKQRNQGVKSIPAPIVVNITDGMPCEYHCDEKEAISKATKEAKELMDIKADDGNVLLFNLHLSSNGNTLQFPKDLDELDGTPEALFLYEISSSLDDNMVLTAKKSGLETARKGSRGMITNASGSLISKFISFGSAVSGVTNI